LNINRWLSLGKNLLRAARQEQREASERQAKKRGRKSSRSREVEVSLSELLRAGLLKSGSRRLSVLKGGCQVHGGIMTNGTISLAGRFYDTPQAFLAHVTKRKVPVGAAAGWDTVLYDGEPLRKFRDAFLGKQPQENGEPTDEDAEEEMEEEEEEVEEEDEEEDDEEHPEGFWIQCDACETWRIVPDEDWDALNAEDLDQWFCQDATWDVTKQTPFTRPCRRRR